MPNQETKVKWENIRARLARAINFTRARSVTVGLSSTTLESSIAEAIVQIDSAQFGNIESLGEKDQYLEDNSGVNSGANKGSLQKVEDLITLYYGDGTTEGLFSQLSKLAEPNSD
jgi:hypothetical protein